MSAPLLRSRSFRAYFLGRSASFLGDVMLPIGLTAAVLAEGHGVSGVGFALAASLGPTIVFMVFGGALADHFRPKPLMVVADVVRFAAQGALAVGLVLGQPSLGQILVLQAVYGTATALFQPCVSGIVPEVAPRQEQQANALLRITESLVTLAGPALAGVLVAVTSPAVVIGVVAVSCLGSGVLVATLRLATARTPGRRPRVLRDIREGWHEFAARRWLWSTITVFAGMGLLVFGPFHVLSAAVLTERHGIDAYGLLMSAHGAGAVLGGVIGLRSRPSRPLRAGAIALIAYAPQFLFLGLGAAPVLIALAMFAGGVGRSYWAVMWSTSVQTAVPAAVLNRVAAYEITGSMMLIPVGRALAGPAAESAGSDPLLLLAGGFCVLGCATLLAVPAIRDLVAFRRDEEERLWDNSSASA